MPELPEVEHARRTLAGWLGLARIEKVTVHDARILDEGVRPSAIVRGLAGRRVEAVERRGKWLRLVLDKGLVFSHLGMTGKWVLARPNAEPVRFEKLRLDVLGGPIAGSSRGRGPRRLSVRYLDPRLFGRFVFSKKDLLSWTELGPDPVLDGIDAATLHATLAGRRLAIKPTLLDQTVLAGVGNIYATEALWAARIDPRRPSRDLSRAETALLAKAIVRVMARAMKLLEGEDSITYVEEPGAENPFTIYGREGTPCPRCKRPLGKMVLAGRGTVFCSHCQS